MLSMEDSQGKLIGLTAEGGSIKVKEVAWHHGRRMAEISHPERPDTEA
jgi:hypothetical protein